MSPSALHSNGWSSTVSWTLSVLWDLLSANSVQVSVQWCVVCSHWYVLSAFNGMCCGQSLACVVCVLCYVSCASPENYTLIFPSEIQVLDAVISASAGYVSVGFSYGFSSGPSASPYVFALPIYEIFCGLYSYSCCCLITPWIDIAWHFWVAWFTLYNKTDVIRQYQPGRNNYYFGKPFSLKFLFLKL